MVDSHSEDPRSACVRLCNEVQKKKINIAGNPLMVRLRRCQWKAGTLRRHSYGNSLLSPAVAGGSDYVSTLIGYWCPINDTLTLICTRALESAHTPLHACTLSRQLEDKISVTKCLFLYSFIIKKLYNYLFLFPSVCRVHIDSATAVYIYSYILYKSLSHINGQFLRWPSAESFKAHHSLV